MRYFCSVPVYKPQPPFWRKIHLKIFTWNCLQQKEKHTRKEENRNAAIFLLVKHKTVEKMKTKQCKWTNVTLFFWAFVCRYQIRIESRRESRRNKRVMMTRSLEKALARTRKFFKVGNSRIKTNVLILMCKFFKQQATPKKQTAATTKKEVKVSKWKAWTRRARASECTNGENRDPDWI